MELVRLSRAGAEPWGFRLVGGADYSTPLTVVKVSPGSPAERAGLSHGDQVRYVAGADAAGLTHDAAKAAVAAATDVLELGVARGLYDPVLDDFDPIYEPIDQDDFDQPSQPTEVFQIKQFTETPDFLGDNPNRSRTGSSGNPDFRACSESRGLDRSLTESPFLLPSKPYRPFSTEPTPVPPLEEPIILNPSYHDEFGKTDDGVNGFEDGLFGETRFKLPISAQYDPDGTKSKKTNEVKVESATIEVRVSEETMIQQQKEEVKFMEKMKKEIDLDKIEMTAANIVDESIEKAVTVADEIKKEIDLELNTTASEIKSAIEVSETKSILKNKKEESIKQVSNLISVIDETTDDILKKSDVSVARGVAKFESVNNHETNLNAQKISTKQELEETIVTGSVRRKSEMYEKDVKETDLTSQKKFADDDTTEKHFQNKRDVKEVKSSHECKDSEFKSEKMLNSESTTKSEKNTTKESKYTTAKLLAEQRAYTIGLQTIPHIKGTVQSSYHYDLLLKTFFIHLTDVMVALSRFILAEPVLSKPLETKPDSTKVDKNSTEISREVVESVVERTVTNDRKVDNVQKEERQTREHTDNKIAEVVKSNQIREIKTQGYADLVEKVITENEMTEKKTLKTGAEMAQLTEKRSEEFIHKMDGVITEFQTKAGLEEEIISQRDRRSRSHSKLEEEVMKESDPLEWLSKVDKKTSEITEIKASSSTLKSTESKHESTEITRESKLESKESANEDGKNTYIAIVEAHVYTNKNAILDKKSEISETTSRQSIEETSVIVDVNESTEHVAIESQTREQNTEVSKSEISTAKITEKSAKTEDIIKEQIKELINDSQKASEFETKHVTQVEVIETVQPIVELQEDIVEKTNFNIEINNKIDIQEIQSSEYVGELNIVNEESLETVQINEVEEVIEVQDISKSNDCVKIEEIISVAIDKDIHDVQISEEMVSIKEECVSIAKEERKEMRGMQVSEESVATKKESLSITSESQNAQISEDIVSLKEESVSVSEVKEVIKDVKVADETTIVKESITAVSDTEVEVKDESAQLKVTKEEITEIREDIEINQEIEVNIRKSVQICESENKYQSYTCETSTDTKEFIQESSFIAKSSEDMKKLTLDTNLKKSDSETSVKSTIDTPTPSTVPPTPLTDEYVFRLQIPLPKITGPPIPRSPTPEDEDPHIVKKHLVPHIDTEIIEEVVYDTPLPTPPADKVAPPVYTKPGLKGGNLRYMYKKEEILEIERKSSLLASAIDQTIKSIEEYKEEVGIDTKPAKPLVYNGYAKVIETRVFNADKGFDQVNVEQQVIKNTDSLNKIVESKENIRTEGLVNGYCEKPATNLKNSNQIPKTEASESKMDETEEVVDVEGYRPVPFNPDDAPHLERVEIRIPGTTPTVDPGKAFVAEDGEIIGSHQGIVDGLEDAVVDEELANEQGKPGMTEEKIAELISGESEMLREAHVMGLTRVLKSHMHRNEDDSSVDFKKIKPIVESLKDSEVLKALNEEFTRTLEEKKKEERKWTKFLQKPSRPVPRAKFGCHGYVAEEDNMQTPYKVKIVKQPKPKIAPDYKPEDFNTGPLPWEERALKEPPPPPVEPEAPILVPEEQPQFLEALDNLPESEVPDLEETGIPLPPEKPTEEPKPVEPEEVEVAEEAQEQEVEEKKIEEETNSTAEMEENRIAEQLMKNVEGMVDPNAPLAQQLAQMRAQLAALAQLPGVIQQTLELVTRQLCQITQQESQQSMQHQIEEAPEAIEESNENSETIIEDVTEEKEESAQIEEVTVNGVEPKEEQVMEQKQEVTTVSAEEIEKMRREEEEILGEQRRIEKQKKELMAELQLDQESRKLKQRPTPPAGKPKPVFGPLTPAERPLVLPGGRKWRKPKDAYNDQFIAETLTAQAEIIQGKAMGKTYESVHLPYDERESNCHLVDFHQLRDNMVLTFENIVKNLCARVQFTCDALTASGRSARNYKDAQCRHRDFGVWIHDSSRVNFMKYEKPPVSLDHLQHSDVYKLIHDMEQAPARRVDMLTPVIAEADYREKCRSMTPCANRIC